MDRCSNVNNQDYHNYGGRGIKVCKRWQELDNFIKDMGDKPSKEHSLDRIDNDGDYEPYNCRWASKEQQDNNKRTNVYLEYKGEKMTLSRWARKLGISKEVMHYRIKAGWSVEDIIEKKIRPYKKNI